MPIDPVIVEYAKTYGLPLLEFGVLTNLASYAISLSDARKKNLTRPISSFREMDCYVRGGTDRELGLMGKLFEMIIWPLMIPGEYAAYLTRKHIC